MTIVDGRDMGEHAGLMYYTVIGQRWWTWNWWPTKVETMLHGLWLVEDLSQWLFMSVKASTMKHSCPKFTGWSGSSTRDMPGRV